MIIRANLKLFLLGLCALISMSAEADSGAVQWARAILQGIEQHPLLLAGRQKVYGSAQATEAAAQPLYNPELEFGWDKKEHFDGDENYYTAIRQTMDWADKREVRQWASQLAAGSAESAQRGRRESLLADALSAAVAVTIAERLLNGAEQQQQLLERLIGLLERRQQAGSASRIELELGYLALARELEASAAAEQRLGDARLQLMNALPGGDFPAQLPTGRLQPPAPATDMEAIVKALPAVETARQHFASQQANIELARRQRKADPTLGLVGGKDDDDKYIGVSFSIPLFVRNSFEAEVLAAGYRATEAEHEYQEALRTARNRLESTLRSYRQLQRRWQTWQRITDQRLDNSYQLLQRLWQSGEITTSDYVVQLQQRAKAQISGYHLEAQLWQSWIKWLMASGQVEQWLQGLIAVDEDGA